MVIKIGLSMGVTMFLTKYIVKLMEPMIDPNYKQKQDAARSRKSLMQRLGPGATPCAAEPCAVPVCLGACPRRLVWSHSRPPPAQVATTSKPMTTRMRSRRRL